jgi:hypothetical protein
MFQKNRLFPDFFFFCVQFGHAIKSIAENFSSVEERWRGIWAVRSDFQDKFDCVPMSTPYRIPNRVEAEELTLMIDL